MLVQLTKHEAVSLSWSTVVGLLRAGNGAGVGALDRQYHRGYREGLERGRSEVQRGSVDGVVRAELESLRRGVEEFEKASGISLKDGWFAGNIGQAVAVVRKFLPRGQQIGPNLVGTAAELIQLAENLRAVADQVTALMAPGEE